MGRSLRAHGQEGYAGGVVGTAAARGLGVWGVGADKGVRRPGAFLRTSERKAVSVLGRSIFSEDYRFMFLSKVRVSGALRAPPEGFISHDDV